MKFYKIGKYKVKVEESDRDNKQLKATLPSGKVIHFGDKQMKEYPNTKRGDNYCSRSYGISKDNKISANLLSRKILWNCNKDKSEQSLKKANVKLISMEEFY